MKKQVFSLILGLSLFGCSDVLAGSSESDYASYYKKAQKEYESGNKQSALDDLNKAINLNPNDANVYNDRGLLKDELGDKQGALDDLNKAISLNPKLALAYFTRGYLKNDLRDKQGALDDFKKAAELYKKEGNTDSYNTTIKLIRKLSH